MDTKTTPNPTLLPRMETEGQELLIPDYYGDNTTALAYKIVKLLDTETDGPTVKEGTSNNCNSALRTLAASYIEAGWDVFFMNDVSYAFFTASMYRNDGSIIARLTYRIRPN